ncbi:MAG: alpha-L-fucosidase [Bacteroidota bacterium]
MNHLRAVRFVSLFFLITVIAADLSAQAPPETADARNARMAWWREARFGMFIHWGIYSVPAKGEWYMNNAKIPIPVYEKYATQFDPVKFNALQWVRLAKAAGMKYIVITSKHHDGFCMWDSKVTDYDIMDRTPFHRDVLKELAAACKTEGMRLCFYHSIMDWHQPDAKGERFPKYREEYLKPQLKELLTNYGPIGVLWFDGEWISEWTEQEGKDLYQYVRSLQPAIIVNNRVGKGRNGLEGMNTDPSAAGDFGTPEQEIPATGLPGVDWESCMTMNDDWGYNAADTNWKSTSTLIHNLVDITSKGGNYLLNVGPTSLGIIPEPSVDRLKEIGAWMAVNSESIYGTTASPFDSTPWGRCTQKKLSSGGTRLYLHLFTWPENNLLCVTGLGTFPKSALLLGSKRTMLPLSISGDSAIVRLPASPPSTIDAVVALDFPGRVVVFKPPVISTDIPMFVDSAMVAIASPDPALTIRYTTNGSEPGVGSSQYLSPFPVSATTTVKARSFHKDQAVSTTSEFLFRKVSPLPSMIPTSYSPGLAFQYFEGVWDSIPRFQDLNPFKSGVVDSIGLSMKKRQEYYGVRLKGFINIPESAVYRFGLSSDDGSRLFIDGEKVIENDGLHSASERLGFCPLARGMHSMEILYFNKTGDAALGVRMGTGSGALQEVKAGMLYH